MRGVGVRAEREGPERAGSIPPNAPTPKGRRPPVPRPARRRARWRSPGRAPVGQNSLTPGRPYAPGTAAAGAPAGALADARLGAGALQVGSVDLWMTLSTSSGTTDNAWRWHHFVVGYAFPSVDTWEIVFRKRSITACGAATALHACMC